MVGLGLAEGTAIHSSAYTADASRDFIFSGGSQVESNPLNSIRSGNPGEHTVVAFQDPLLAGIVISQVSFQYRYISGFGPTGVGSNFSLRVAGSSVYSSPEFTKFSYNQNRSNYSPPISVHASGLQIQVPKTGNTPRVEFAFNNNGRNVQLLLPITVTVTWTGGPCAVISKTTASTTMANKASAMPTSDAVGGMTGTFFVGLIVGMVAGAAVAMVVINKNKTRRSISESPGAGGQRHDPDEETLRGDSYGTISLSKNI